LGERSIFEIERDYANTGKHEKRYVELLDYLFSDPGQCPDALILAGVKLTSTALYHLPRNGIRIPEDVSIIGMMQESEGKVLYPGITSIQRNLASEAQIATQMLMQLVQDNTVRRPQVYVETQLVHRNTTCSRLKGT